MHYNYINIYIYTIKVDNIDYVLRLYMSKYDIITSYMMVQHNIVYL